MEIWHIFKCCKCKRYVDKETRQIVRKPDGKVISHGYCDDCADAFRAEIKAMGGDRK